MQQQMQEMIRKSFTLFENPKIRWSFVLLSFVLHLVSGILVLKFKDSTILTVMTYMAALSLVPLILFSESIKKLGINLFIAIFPIPLLMTLFLAGVDILTGKGVTLSSLSSLSYIFLGILFMLLFIAWECLLTALILRLLAKFWVSKSRS